MAQLELQIRDAKNAIPTWNAVTGGKRAWVCFDDFLETEIGEDPTSVIFEALVARMMTGNYYPSDVIEFFGEFRSEGRDMRVGDRIVQRARIIPFVKNWFIYSVAEIYVCERNDDSCKIGYVTTNRHFGRGIWDATLRREDGKLILTVKSIASPGSIAFWMGLPYARWLQLRARRRAVESFQAFARR
jgi:hypothetical protein